MTLDRRSTPSGYITHTVSAPSLHGKTVRGHRTGVGLFGCVWKLWAELPTGSAALRLRSSPLEFSLASSGASQPEELTLLLIQLRRHRAKMASARQETLAQLGRLHAPEEPERRFPSGAAASSPFLCTAPSPVSWLGSSSPLGSFNAKVGPRLSAHPSFDHRLLEVAAQVGRWSGKQRPLQESCKHGCFLIWSPHPPPPWFFTVSANQHFSI